MCLRHRPTPRLHWNNTSGAGLCYSPPQKINEGLSIHHNSLATQGTDSSIILFLPKLAGTVSLCSSFWHVCVFPPLSICQLFFQDRFWLSLGGTGSQCAPSPVTPTLLREVWVFCHWNKSITLYKLILFGAQASALKKGLCAYSCDHGLGCRSQSKWRHQLLCKMRLSEIIFTWPLLTTSTGCSKRSFSGSNSHVSGNNHYHVHCCWSHWLLAPVYRCLKNYFGR